MIRLPKSDPHVTEEARPELGIDPAAAELLAPPDTAHVAADPVAPTAQVPTPAATYEQALRDGLIPTFEDQPADTAFAEAPPADPDTERAHWQQLVDFITANKNPATTVQVADLATFSKGLD